MAYQKVIVEGNLGRDPEMRYLPSGQAVTNFTLANNRQYTNSSGEKVKETTWFRVSAWGKLAEVTNQYLKIGSKVLVDGRLKPNEKGSPRTWMKDGEPQSSFELTAERVEFLDTKSTNDAITAEDVTGGYTEQDDEVPF